MASSTSLVRIPYRPAEVLPKTIPPLNLFRMLAHSPSTLPHLLSLGTACFRDTSLSPYTNELVSLWVSRRTSSDYHWKKHVPTAKATGLTEEQILAVASGNVQAASWSEKDMALLSFLDAVITGPEVSNEIFSKAREHFNDQALVEVVVIQVRGIPKGYNEVSNFSMLKPNVRPGLLLQHGTGCDGFWRRL
ncbi:AhpD-like protein [Amylocarpus encephaloides]|uniref:AhpD-like protein n=1 Tax=Amylocarpus encephaloides TaxID=45428 RepID=A0A9P7Y6U6_9HELO|nr:AhpD-like protein [Amylocarpus encephaloides]